MFLFLSLSNVVSQKRKGRKEKRNAELRVLGLVVSNTILEDKKKIKKDKKGQREQRDKFRVSNFKKKKREVFPSSKGLFFVLFFVLTSKGIIYIIPKRDRTTLSLSLEVSARRPPKTSSSIRDSFFFFEGKTRDGRRRTLRLREREGR